MNKLNDDYSRTIDVMRILLILCVVVLHSFCTAQIPNMSHEYWATAYLFSLIFGEIGVPGCFFISGFLFFQSEHFDVSTYKRKLKSRVKSLLIPFLIWNSIMIFVYFLLQSIPSLSQFASGVVKDFGDMSAVDFIRLYWDRGDWNEGNGMPVLGPYWYIRNLMMLVLISPVIMLFMKYLKYWLLIPLIALWMLDDSLAFSASSLLFFTMGGIMGMQHLDILKLCQKYRYVLHTLGLVSVMADLYFHVFDTTTFELYIHRTTLIVGLFWLLLISKNFASKVSHTETLASLSFFIYTIHHPLISVLKKLQIKFVNSDSALIQILLYWALIVVTVLICTAIYRALNKCMPKLLSISMGSRIVKR